MTEIVNCPDESCGLPAEITRRDFLDSTDGPVEHIGLVCISRHVFFMPSEILDRNNFLNNGDLNNEQAVK